MAPAMATAGCAMTLTAGEASRDDFDHLQTDGRRVWCLTVSDGRTVLLYSYTEVTASNYRLSRRFFCTVTHNI